MGHGLKVIYEYAETNIPSLNPFNLNLNARDLWPIVILCDVTILLSLLWLLAVHVHLSGGGITVCCGCWPFTWGELKVRGELKEYGTIYASDSHHY